MGSIGRASVVLAIVIAALTACDSDGSVDRPTAPASSNPRIETAVPTPPASSPSLSAKPHPAAMREVALRSMYLRGTEGILISGAGTTETGRNTSAYVPTRRGAVFTSGDQVYELADGGTPAAIGSVAEHAVFLQVDPTLRYVTWEVRRPDDRHARVFVYDSVAHRMVLDRVLLWSDRNGRFQTTSFGAPRLRLAHLSGWDFWTFATLSGRTLVTPGGQLVDLRTHELDGPRVSRGLWSPGLRYRVSGPRRGHPWQVVDLSTGKDVTPATLLEPGHRAARLTGWLGNRTFGVLRSSGTWRHTTVTAEVCTVAGRCRVVWRQQRGPDDSGLSSSTEID